MSRLVAVAPVLPRHVHPQAEISATIGPLLTDRPAADDGAPRASRAAALRRLHAGSGVVTRHLALPLAEYPTVTSFTTANDHFVRVGLDLAAEATTAALDAAGLGPRDVDLVLFTSVTGISAPSLDALLVGRLGMREDVRRMPSFGWGCAGGAAGVARVHDYLVGHPHDVALLVSVELCSLTLQHGDDSTANLVSSGLFGDGGAAVVVVGSERVLPGEGAGPRAAAPVVLDSRSRLYPATEDQLGWRVTEGGFRIVLSAGMPSVVRAHLEDDVRALLEPHDLKVRDVAAWVVHAGGPRILDAVQEALDLDPEALDGSRASLAAVGNLSSASVLHVLAGTMADPPPPGSHGVMVAFGPGVSCELVLLRWEA